MKKFLSLLLIACLAACNNFSNETITGNGNIRTETRNYNCEGRIKLQGSFDVYLIPGSDGNIIIEADENVIPYIVSENRNGYLSIKAREGFNLKSKQKIKISVACSRLTNLQIAGSGSFIGQDKFSGMDELKLEIAGSGNITLHVNTPKVDAGIAGSGNINLKGETRDASIEINGHGDYNAEELKAENVKVEVNGSGKVRVHADKSLEMDITGSGDVYYRGNPSIHKDVTGSGKAIKID